MNLLLSALSWLLRRPQFASGKSRTSQRETRRQRLCLEALEDRLVLSPTVSIANASMNEIGNVSAFVASGSGGLSGPQDLVLGPDGNIYVASGKSNSVIRYTPSGQLLGTFVAAGSGGLSSPSGLAFGPDGNLYVGSESSNTIDEYSGTTGAFLSTFVTAGSGGLNDPKGLVFGPDGNLYVSSHLSGNILRYEGPGGANPGAPLPAAGQSGATFVAQGSGGLDGPKELLFAPDGSLYVSSGVTDFAVLRFDGTTGTFLNTVVALGAGGLQNPTGLALDQDGRLYVADAANNAIHVYDSQGNYLDDLVTSSASSLNDPLGMIVDSQGDLLISSRNTNAVDEYNSGVVVTLSSASSAPVSVNYATADGTATAGKDYTAQSGTVTFAPGQTSHLVLLSTVVDPVMDGNETFNVQLSNPTGATIANGNAVVTIAEPAYPQLSVGNTSAIEGDTTAHYRGAAAWGATTNRFNPVTIGPDGNIYTAVGTGPGFNTIERYNGTTGAFMGTFATGPLAGVRTIVFRNGYMYVANEASNQVLQYNATTGAYIGVFASGGISGMYGMTFGPDGNLYVSGRNSNNVVEYNGTTGALIGTFVAAGSGGLNLPEGIAFDPSGQYLYVASSGGPNQVLKYNAQTGAYVGAVSSGTTRPTDVKFGSDGLMYVLDASGSDNAIMRFTENGAFVDNYVSNGAGGLSGGQFMAFGPNGDIYVGSTGNNQILQFGTENESLFTVSLSAPFAEPVTVNYATADGTALAGTNYTATSGTLTFAPGVTTQTIRVPILDSGSQTTPLTFSVNLSSPQLATLSQSQASGTIEPSDQAAKFYVLNNPVPGSGGRLAIYKYQANGTEQAPFALSQSDNDPYGLAVNPAGTKVWVWDRNGNIYVYSPTGTLLGSWTPGGLPAEVSPQGITTDGTNIWLMDATTNKVFEYAGAAGLLSGSQNATSSFKVAKGDPGPANLVTDGKSIWVVDNSNGKVFKYTVAGKLLGSWAVDPADVDPVGITVNPSNPSDVWIVDAYTHEVYDYAGAASRTSGSQKASATFALAAGDTSPMGIADPPTENMLVTKASLPGAPSGAVPPSSSDAQESAANPDPLAQLQVDSSTWLASMLQNSDAYVDALSALSGNRPRHG